VATLIAQGCGQFDVRVCHSRSVTGFLSSKGQRFPQESFDFGELALLT